MGRNRLLNKRTGGILLAALLAVSCQENTLYHSYRPVGKAGWDKADTLVYPLPEALPVRPYGYRIGIRHKDSYPYRDLWLEVNGDTVHLYLTDSTGNWKGQGFGEMRQLDVAIRPAIPQEDSIREFRIRHIMRDNPLTGIHDIGLHITRP